MIASSVLGVVGFAAAALSIIGILQTLAGLAATLRFAAREPAPRLVTGLPAVTVLKPLHGDEPLLERALATLCEQDYPVFQILCGVSDSADPAIEVVDRLRRAYPRCDIAVVIDPATHGPNHKVSNLINMLPDAKYDILVIADSDMHVQPDYLADLVATLAEPETGLVTTLYAGLPANRALPAELGATLITHSFLPGALLARALGRHDCLGATMCLRRETLGRIGGFHALVDHLADDNLLGVRVSALGFAVRLASTVPATTVPEATFAALFRHELRWARTIRALAPVGFAASVLQYPLFFALLEAVVTPRQVFGVGLFFVAWIVRAFAATGIDNALAARLDGLAIPAPVWLLPLRELLSVGVMLASYTGRRVDWRGHMLEATGLGSYATNSRGVATTDKNLAGRHPVEGYHSR